MSTILLVEDEQPIAHLIHDLLTEEGYEVILAEHGREALEVLTRVFPDLIVIDLMMPIMDGVELGRHIRSDARFDSVPLILMSAARKLSREPHFTYQAFIAKPFEVTRLLNVIEATLAGATPSRPAEPESDASLDIYSSDEDQSSTQDT